MIITQVLINHKLQNHVFYQEIYSNLSVVLKSFQIK